MILIVDNYDSFTYNLNDYFIQCGAKTCVWRNDAFQLTDIDKKIDGIVLSPGPGRPSDAGKTMDVIKEFSSNIPLLGVCLGMQAMGVFYGAELIKSAYPMHGKVSEIAYMADHPMFVNIDPPLEVCRYHSLTLNNIDRIEHLQVLANTSENEVMAIAHKSYPSWGVQFHPEAILTSQGLLIIKNWLNHFNLQ